MSTKDKILQLLENNLGQSLSGEEMAKSLHISRNAVWKGIQSLKKDGHQIDAVRNSGYTLLKDNNILSVAGMLPHLANADQAAKIKVFPSLESTNKTAKELAIIGHEHGVVIIADTQTAGRGRLGRSFYSPSGTGLYLSFILRPEYLNFENPTAITAFAAVSVCEAIAAATQKTAMIKWVNDIFLNGVKIGGILTEAITNLETSQFQWIVLGIGINFNTPAQDFPNELRRIVSSIYSDESPNTTRNYLAAKIINKILGENTFSNEEELFKKYKEFLFILGKKMVVNSPQGNYEATPIDINPVGHLIVKKADEEILTLSSGEVSIRPTNN